MIRSNGFNMPYDPVIFDFLWDDQQDLGVWVQPNDGGDLVLVEASISVRPSMEPEDNDYDDPFNFEPTGNYLLASDIKLQPNDGVWINPKTGPIYGIAAEQALKRLQKIERESKQIAVNEQQEALLKR